MIFLSLFRAGIVNVYGGCCARWDEVFGAFCVLGFCTTTALFYECQTKIEYTPNAHALLQIGLGKTLWFFFSLLHTHNDTFVGPNWIRQPKKRITNLRIIVKINLLAQSGAIWYFFFYLHCVSWKIKWAEKRGIVSNQIGLPLHQKILDQNKFNKRQQIRIETTAILWRLQFWHNGFSAANSIAHIQWN